MKSIKSLNECFIKCFANADTFKNAQKTSDIDADISDLINNKIPTMLSDYIKGNYKSKASLARKYGISRQQLYRIIKEINRI